MLFLFLTVTVTVSAPALYYVQRYVGLYYTENKDYMYYYWNYRYHLLCEKIGIKTKAGSDSESKSESDINNNNNNNKKVTIMKIVKNGTDTDTDTVTNQTKIEALENVLSSLHHEVEESKPEATEDSKYHIVYIYNDEIYRICTDTLNLKHFESDKNSEPKQIVWAYLKKNDGTILEVTDIIKLHQGPFKNFHTKINGVSNKIVDMFTGLNHLNRMLNLEHLEHLLHINLLEWDQLLIEDIYEETVIEINKDTIDKFEYY